MNTSTQYKAIKARIAKEQDYKKLNTLATNIERAIARGEECPQLGELRDAASQKAKVLRILSKCPKPTDDSLLEEIAFTNFVEGSAILDATPSPRVIHHQLKRLGYAKTAARQVEREIGSRKFLQMVARGAVRHTSEYFVLKYGRHLVSKKTLEALLAYASQNGHVLEFA